MCDQIVQGTLHEIKMEERISIINEFSSEFFHKILNGLKNPKNEVTSAETAGKNVNGEKLESILFFPSYFKVTKH